MIYNPRTDELHLVPSTGSFVYELCDGTRTVQEIEEILCRRVVDSDEVRSRLGSFLGQLAERGLLVPGPHV